MSDLDGLINMLGLAIEGAQLGSPRDVTLRSARRFAERARAFMEASTDSTLPYRMLASALEVRDMARAEQAAIDVLFRDEMPNIGAADTLRLYKVKLAIVESTMTHSIAFVGSDRESSEDAGWWAARAGAATMDVVTFAPELVRLPHADPNA